MSKVTTEASRFVGDIPVNYDSRLGPVIFEGYAADIAARAAAHGPKHVLETAAGTGIVTRRLRDALAPHARLTATDLNAPMLDIAKARFQPGEAVAFETADATALPFPDESFEALVCQFGLMFFPDKDASLREARRLLKPGGRYLFNVWDSLRYNPFSRIALETAERLFPDDPPQFFKIPFSCSEIDPIKEALIGAGFGGIVVSVLPLRREVRDLEAFARGLVFGTPLVEQIKPQGDDAPERAAQALAHAFAREFGSSPATLPMQAIMFEAERA
jgi:SAM-dependent methyltransferase